MSKANWVKMQVVWTVFFIFCPPSFANYSGGSGTPRDPYQIANADDLLELAGDISNYDKCFILTADIDLDPNLPGGQIFTTAIIAPDTDSSSSDFQGTTFMGTFDGNGHKITNFTINGGNNETLGLFGYIDISSQIKNLGIENYTVSGSSGSGGLVGLNAGTITTCYATGNVTGTGGSYYVGGLVGFDAGTITTCYATGTVSGGIGVGGLVGGNYYGTITECYATGTVSGDYYIGGLVGSNYRGKVIHCYSTGKPTGSSFVGGLCGAADSGGMYEDTGNFWDTDTSEISTSAMGLGRTTVLMKTLSTFTSAGWDFVEVWGIGNGQTYPYLKPLTGINPADINYSGTVDMQDLVILAANWLDGISGDINPPTPNPAQWATEPYSSGTGAISMTAVTAIDAEGNGVEYSFECVNDSSLSSGWISIATYTLSGLSAGQTYIFHIKYRDTSNNYNNTDYSPLHAVTVDDDSNPPMPNPAQWDGIAGRPIQVDTSIQMTAAVATDAEGNGVEYYFECMEDSDLSSGWIASRSYAVTTGLVTGQTYTFRVKYRDTSINHNTTDYSASAAVTISEADIEPPVPNPTALIVSWFYQSGQYYHILAASPVTDESGFVEYQYQCTDNATILGSMQGVWFNDTNMVANAYPTGSMYYPDGFTLKVPNMIWVPVSSGIMNYTYQVRTRDLYENTGNWSDEATSE